MSDEARAEHGPVGRGAPLIAPRRARRSWLATTLFACVVIAIVAAGTVWSVRRVQAGMPTRADPNPLTGWREHRKVGLSADLEAAARTTSVPAPGAAAGGTAAVGGASSAAGAAPPPLPDAWPSAATALPPLPAVPTLSTPASMVQSAHARPADDVLLVPLGGTGPDATAGSGLAGGESALEPAPSTAGQPWQSPFAGRRWSRAGRANATLSAGNTIDCVLQTRLDSTLPGMTTCVVTRDVYSDDGTRVLVARGALAIGEYRATLQAGQRRLFVLWTRIRTPGGLLLRLESPATDALGASGVAGDVDEHWLERIGAAFMLSFIQDAIGYTVQERSNAGTSGQTFVFPATAQTGNQMADRVLQSTINIPPTLTKNPGERVLIMVAHDLDLSGSP